MHIGNSKILMNQRGETIISLLTGIMIFGLLIGGIAMFQLNIFRNSKNVEEKTKTSQQIIITLRNLTSELRQARSSSTGGYALETATNDTLVFYSDINNDGAVERVRYARVNGNLERGITVPTGSPLSYGGQPETVTTLITSVSAESPLFLYYGSEYTGTTETSPLPYPPSIQDIRSVGIEITALPESPDLPPASAHTLITIRNLKSN